MGVITQDSPRKLTEGQELTGTNKDGMVKNRETNGTVAEMIKELKKIEEQTPQHNNPTHDKTLKGSSTISK